MAQQLIPVATLRVASHSRPSAVAGAIAGVMRSADHVEVQAIGAGATNQAIKAIAIARAYVQDEGIDLCCVPFFADIIVDGEERTAMRFLVTDVHRLEGGPFEPDTTEQ